MPFFKKNLDGSGYVMLNIVRGMNILSLFLMSFASGVMLVKTFVVSKFFFFDEFSHLVTCLIAAALLISELGLFRRYIANNWPLFSLNSGFITLGIAMIILSANILGNLNKTATSHKALGNHWWQIVIAAGILGGLVGIINIVANYLFRNKAHGLTARQIRQYGKTAAQVPITPSTTNSSPPRKSFSFGKRSVSEGHYDTHPAYRQRDSEVVLPPGRAHLQPGKSEGEPF